MQLWQGVTGYLPHYSCSKMCWICRTYQFANKPFHYDDEVIINVGKWAKGLIVQKKRRFLIRLTQFQLLVFFQPLRWRLTRIPYTKAPYHGSYMFYEASHC